MDLIDSKVYTVLFLAVLILAVILIFFIITTLKHHRINARLYEMQLKAEINTLEAERKRIAADLHDDIGPLLSSVKMQIDCLNTEDEEDLETVERVGKYMDDIMLKLRETSNDLMPRVLTKKGLLMAIEDFATDLNKTKKLQVETKIIKTGIKLQEDKEVHIYRVVQEIVNNAIKHAQATKFNISIYTRKKRVVFDLADNGNGFEFYKVAKESMGLGLKNIIRRIDMLDGDVYFDSSPGKGSKYTIEIPLDA